MPDQLPNQDQPIPQNPADQAVPQAASPAVRREHELAPVVTPMDHEGLPPVEIPPSLEDHVAPITPPPAIDPIANATQSIPVHHTEPKGQVVLPDHSHIQAMAKGKSWKDAITWINKLFGRQQKMNRNPQTI